MVNPSDATAVRTQILDALAGADAGFSGRLYSLDNLRATFRVDEVWKGEFSASVTLPTRLRFNPDGTISFTSCDPRFELHRSYLILLYRDRDGALQTDRCSMWTEAGMKDHVAWLKEQRQK